MLRLLLTLVIFVSGLHSAFAQSYAPGTTGYLYQSCRTMLEQSESLRDAHSSYCGAFAEGYIMGLLIVNSGEIPKPNTSDPCRIDKEKAYSHINQRFCTNFSALHPDRVKAGEAVQMIATLIDEWAIKNKQRLHQNATESMASLIKPGHFCSRLSQDVEKDDKVSTALKTLSWPQIFGAKSLTSMDQKFKQCQSDILKSKGNKAAFKSTICGAEISGFIAGLSTGNHIQKSRVQTTRMCEKPISRLYDSLDVSQTMCIKTSTDPLLVARIFTRNFELIRGKKKAWSWSDLFDAGDLGAVGYETIYRGFLCRNQAELNARR